MVLKTVAITGSSGMLGSHTEFVLNKNNLDIKTVNRTNKLGTSGVWNLNNWLSDSEMSKIFSEIDLIVHCACMVPLNNDYKTEEMFNVNVRSTVNLGSWALRNNIPLIYVSGGIVYRDPYAVNQNEDSDLGWNDIGNFYGYSKLLSEKILKDLELRGLKLAILRPTSIYGLGLPEEKIIQRFLNIAQKGSVIKLKEPINESVDFIHAYDVAQAIALIIKNNCWDTFNLSSSNPISMINLANCCIDIYNKGTIKIEKNFKDCKSKFSLNSEKAFLKLSWKPQIDLKNGLKLLQNKKLAP